MWRTENGQRVELIRPATGLTSRGRPPVEGHTVAVDPSIWSYGTKIEIEGLGTRVAGDCGGDVRGFHLDVFVTSHERAAALGRRERRARRVR